MESFYNEYLKELKNFLLVLNKVIEYINENFEDVVKIIVVEINIDFKDCFRIM